MSEQLFILNGKDEFLPIQKVGENVNSYLKASEVEKLLNEQQATIKQQEEEIKKFRKTERSWRKIHCCNEESDNCGILQRQQATITSLQEQLNNLRQKIGFDEND